MAELSTKDQLFGKIALKNQLVSETQLKECMALFQKSGEGDLAATLVAQGYVSDNHATAIRRKVDTMVKEKQGASAEAAPKPGGAKPADGVVSAADVAKMDFSDLAGKPLGAYLERVRKLGASDFHFQCDVPPFVRMHGKVVRLKHPVLTREDTERAIREMLTEEQWKIVVESHDLDFCYEREAHGRYRTNVLRQRKGYDIIFRIIPDRISSIEELHLPDSIKKLTEYRQGIVLITGPAGCGKSATMAAMIDLINEKKQDHIITVEDPIEYVFESKSCNVNQRHVHVHTDNFASALRSAMRADPDVIAVGEMRDLETISMAITAAETGHLVLATLHTTNAIRSIDRVIDVFPPKEQEQIRAMVSESMRGVISQQLVPRADGLGREPALELMFSTSAVANLIRERKTFQLLSVLQTGKSQGMVTMDDSIRKLLNQGIITRETAIFHAEDPGAFQK